MPSGCVLRYEGPRGVSWKLKYRDAGGRQVKETLGREPEWNAKRAGRELAVRLHAVERGMRTPRRRMFGDLLDEFEAVSLKAKPRKTSTVVDYKATIRNHLRPWFGQEDLGRLSQSPEAWERYSAGKLGEGLAPKTVRNHLVLAGLLFKMARRWRWVSENPLELVDPPPVPERETETLTAAEVASVLKAYRQLEAGADDVDRPWFAAVRRMTVLGLSTGLIRGELLGLMWMDVELLERRLDVRQSFVRSEMTTPKSKAGKRSMRLGPQAVAALEEQYAETLYRQPEAVVFGHALLGTPLDPSKLTTYARKALKLAGVTDSFRPWHGLRHTALTETAAAGVPSLFVQAKAGHAQASTTERYLHADRTSYPEAAELAEARLFG